MCFNSSTYTGFYSTEFIPLSNAASTCFSPELVVIATISGYSAS
jgi:hypothetical protein